MCWSILRFEDFFPTAIEVGRKTANGAAEASAVISPDLPISVSEEFFSPPSLFMFFDTSRSLRYVFIYFSFHPAGSSQSVLVSLVNDESDGDGDGDGDGLI